MAMAMQGTTRSPRPSGLADVVELILDKGLVIDAFVRVSLIGIELLTVDARIVVASVDTYLRFAEAVNRLDLNEASDAAGIQELTEGMGRSEGKSKTKGALSEGKEKLSEKVGSDDGRERQESSGRRGEG